MRANYQISKKAIEKGAELGYPVPKLSLLFLVPFVQVAWAEGFVQGVEKRTILRFAENFNINEEQGNVAQLKEWLNERPDDEFFERSRADLSELLNSIPAKQAAHLRGILHFGCIEVAQAAGDIGILRGRSGIQREERENLHQIGEQLGLVMSHI